MPLDIRLRRVGAIPAGRQRELKCASIDYSAEVSAVGILRVTLSQHVAANGALSDSEELQVVLFDPKTSTWNEPDFGRYTVLGASRDDTDPTITSDVELVELVSHRLSGASLATMEDRTFTDVTPGWLLGTILTEARTRGAADGITWTFTATHDSDRVAWPKKLTMDLPPGQTALQTLGVLFDLGLISWVARGRELIVRGSQTAGTRHPFVVGRDAKERPVRTSRRDVVTAVTVAMDDGKFIRRTGNTGLGMGQIERHVRASGVTDEATAELIAAHALAEGAPRTELTVTEYAGRMERVPFVDFRLGDWVWVMRNGAAEQVRVSSVQLRRDGENVLHVDLGLKDVIAERSNNLAKRVASIPATGGNGRFKGSGGGGGGGVSIRRGIVDPAYRNGSGSPARVSFDGGATFSDPLDFIAEHPPYANGRVAVVGDLIVGRVAAEPGEVPGSVEYLEPGPGWREVDPARYGPLSIRVTGSQWVVLNGMLEPIPGYTGPNPDVMMWIPGAYLPQRPSSFWMSMASETGAFDLALVDPQTGAVTAYATSGVWSVSGLAYNKQVSDLWNVGNDTRGGVDSEGVVFLIGGTSPSRNDFTAPAAIRPGRTWSYPFWSGSSTYGRYITTSGSMSFNNMQQSFDDIFWTLEGGSAPESQLASPINGYTWLASQPVRFFKTASGIVRIHGLTGGGGVRGQTAFILPPGYRPSHEILAPNGLRITPSGAVSGLAQSAGIPDSTSGYSGSGGSRGVYATFLAGR